MLGLIGMMHMMVKGLVRVDESGCEDRSPLAHLRVTKGHNKSLNNKRGTPTSPQTNRVARRQLAVSRVEHPGVELGVELEVELGVELPSPQLESPSFPMML